MRRYGASNNACRQKWSKKRRPHLGSKDAKNTLVRLTCRNVQSRTGCLISARLQVRDQDLRRSLYNDFKNPSFPTLEDRQIDEALRVSRIGGRAAYALARSRLHVLYRRA